MGHQSLVLVLVIQESFEGGTGNMTAEEIRNSPVSKQLKIIRLYALTMLNYRQPEGDRAWKIMQELTDVDTTQAIATLCGMCLGGAKSKDWLKLLPKNTE